MTEPKTKNILFKTSDLHARINSWELDFDAKNCDIVIGIRSGGVIPAYLLSERIRKRLGLVTPFAKFPDSLKGKKIIIVDDIIDSGATMTWAIDEAKRVGVSKYHVCSLVNKLSDVPEDKDFKNGWIEFPWEFENDDSTGAREQAVVALLRSVGEDPMREGLAGTPNRVNRMYEEIFKGYDTDPKKVLSASFSSESYDEMIVVKDIKYFSMCEHHMLPFYGKVHFAYIPDKQVVGLSKIPRLVECFARRLQIQERMTMQIGKTFEEVADPLGVGVIVEGIHLCTMMRGVKKENVTMKTSYLGGAFREDSLTRTEFMKLIGG